MKKESIFHRLAFAVDLQDEPIPGKTLIEIIDTRRVLIENHRGVNEYGDGLVRVKVKTGDVCIYGSRLKLAKMTKEQLIICGIIESVKLNKEG